MIALYGDVWDETPTDRDLAADYAEQVGIEDAQLPVTIDMTGTLRDQIPWQGTLPGKCAVSREMEILECWSSARNAPGFSAIRDDWESAGD